MKKEDRPLSALFKDLAEQMTLLVRQEADLVRTEVSEKIDQMGKGLASVVLGGLFSFSALLFLLASAVMGLTHLVPPWLSFLIIGLFAAGIGLALLLFGRKALQPKSLMVPKTVDTLAMEKDLVKEQFGHEEETDETR